MLENARRIHQFFSQLGCPYKYSGATYLQEVVCNAVNNNIAFGYLGDLCAPIAKKYQTSTGNIERNIRTLISKWWEYDRCGEIFIGKPTVSEAIHTLISKVNAEFMKEWYKLNKESGCTCEINKPKP